MPRLYTLRALILLALCRQRYGACALLSIMSLGLTYSQLFLLLMFQCVSHDSRACARGAAQAPADLHLAAVLDGSLATMHG